MAPIADPDRLNAYKDALLNWKFTDYIQFELEEEAHRWLKRELNNISLKDIKRLMFEYVINEGGDIDEQLEKRIEWAEKYAYHYDLRFNIQNKPVYIETRLNFCPPFVPDKSWILVVNIHAP